MGIDLFMGLITLAILLGEFICDECITNHHLCAACDKPSDGTMLLCTADGCGRRYHESCAHRLPNATYAKERR